MKFIFLMIMLICSERIDIVECTEETADFIDSVFNVTLNVLQNPKHLEPSVFLYSINSFTEVLYQCFKKNIIFNKDGCLHNVMTETNYLISIYDKFKNKKIPFKLIMKSFFNIYYIYDECYKKD